MKSQDDDGEPRFFNLLLEPIRHFIGDVGLPGIHEMLKFVKSQETYAATLEQFAQTDALAHGIAARPQRIAKLIQQGLGETFHGGSGGYFGQQHRDFHARLVVDARMQAREIGDDRSLAPAAFAHDGATVWSAAAP